LSRYVTVVYVEDIIHNRILFKKIVKRFLKEFDKKYCKKEVFGKYFEVRKDFYVINKKDMRYNSSVNS